MKQNVYFIAKQCELRIEVLVDTGTINQMPEITKNDTKIHFSSFSKVSNLGVDITRPCVKCVTNSTHLTHSSMKYINN